MRQWDNGEWRMGEMADDECWMKNVEWGIG